jgi:hypothetical protein
MEELEELVFGGADPNADTGFGESDEGSDVEEDGNAEPGQLLIIRCSSVLFSNSVLHSHL